MIKAGASESLLTNEWVSNAYKWIMWTLASVARAFPAAYAFGVLSESAVLQRMLYKYEREINRAERSHVDAFSRKTTIRARRGLRGERDSFDDERADATRKPAPDDV